MSTVHRIHPSRQRPDQFQLDVRHEDPGETVVFVRGELDIATTPELYACLSTLLDADTPCPVLVVDLAAAPFVDIRGVNVLLDAHRRAADRGVVLSLAGCRAQLVRVLHVVQMLDVMDLIPVQRACSTVVDACLGNSAHTALPSGNGVTPQQDDTAATTCRPRRVDRAGRPAELAEAHRGRNHGPR
jgi:anti-sigma B factor antagonist